MQVAMKEDSAPSSVENPGAITPSNDVHHLSADRSSASSNPPSPNGTTSSSPPQTPDFGSPSPPLSSSQLLSQPSQNRTPPTGTTQFTPSQRSLIKKASRMLHNQAGLGFYLERNHSSLSLKSLLDEVDTIKAEGVIIRVEA
jgi:hypothetical protein